MQATVYRVDPETGTGSVITDDGVVVPFGAAALEAGGLRHVRAGQRLTAEIRGALDGSGEPPVAVRLTLGTIVSPAP